MWQLGEVKLYQNREIRDSAMDYILPSETRIDTLAEIVKNINEGQVHFDVLVICNSTNHCSAVHSRIDAVSYLYI